MSVGIVITAKNEERLMRSNVLYHLHAGATMIWVFLDNSDDGTRASLSDLQSVRVRDSIHPDELSEDFSCRQELKDTIEQHKSHSVARQVLNFCHATQEARLMGIEWLAGIDADELLCVNPGGEARNSLTEMTTQIPHRCDAILFRPLEILARREAYDNVFAQERLFLSIYSRASKLDKADIAPVREIADPVKGGFVTIRGYFGHVTGKTMVRLSQDFYPSSVHTCSMNSRPIQYGIARWLLHYNTHSYYDLHKKYTAFRNRPPTWINGSPREYVPDIMLEQFINSDNYSDAEKRAYFNRWIKVSDQLIQDFQREHRDSVIRIDSVAEFFLKSE
jgi:hypothetical protein